VDRIASSQTQASEPQSGQRQNKLDYIVDFMRANKLTKFCDLLTSQEPEVRALSEKLNSLSQFTLFVPTNEALLLMPTNQLELIKSRPADARDFLMAHATSELVVPKSQLADQHASKPASATNGWSTGGGLLVGAGSWSRRRQLQASAASTSLIFSLAGGPLRVTSALVPLANRTDQAQQTQSHTQSSRLELIVNGANIVSGHSYALQEPNNNSATYAIVHLVDRPLYPAPSVSLLEKIGQLAPRMASYIELAKDGLANEALESAQTLTTALVPNDDAFRATPSRLLQELETNRTFLVQFVRAHLIPGLFYSGQLANGLAASSDGVANLSALSGEELEFETKMVQSRNLVLVNSIPISDPDIMAINGVLHLIARPIFERKLLDDCNCGNQTRPTEPSQAEAPLPSRAQAQELAAGRSQVVYDGPRVHIESPSSGNELERDESRLSGQSPAPRSRLQRSENLVARNNRDFYRPSAAPANLLLTGLVEPQSRRAGRQELSPEGQIFISQADLSQLLGANESRRNQLASTAPLGLEGPMFEVERYKVVLNATTRQRLRQQQQQQREPPVATSTQFAYDRPMVASSQGSNLEAPTTELSSPNNLRLYSPVDQTTNQANSSSNSSNLDQLALATSRQQRLLKFQAEDARDSPLPGMRLPGKRNESAYSAYLQPNYEVYRATSDQTPAQINQRKQQQLKQQMAGKTQAPPGFGGCAFYDADCKRLVGKLVRLPPTKQLPQEQRVQDASNQLMQTSSSNVTVQHLDSSFGESTENPSSASKQQQPLQQQRKEAPAKQTAFNRLSPPRLSPLNLPLPPWGDDDQRAGQSMPAQNWRTQEADIARLAGGSKQVQSRPLAAGDLVVGNLAARPVTAVSLSPEQQYDARARQQLAQILFMPVKIVPSQSNASQPLKLATAPQVAATVRPSQVNFQRDDFHTPTPYSVSLQTTHLPPIFGNSGPTNKLLSGRLATNFTALENALQLDESPQSANMQRAKSLRTQVDQIVGQIPRAPSAHRKQRLHQIQIDNNGSYGTNFELNPANGEKQAHKIVRLQQTPVEASGLMLADNFDGDISVTSAKLAATAWPAASQATGLTANLATQASNQAPNVSANFVRSAGLGQPAANNNNDPAADFFQNRTIAEIMDDSGLRIDGQQVTFARLQECLAEAGLLSLVTQTGNSLTIFMPTDLAFQRLVQQMALAHQRHRSQPSTSESRLSTSGRLLDPSRRHLIPLVARRNLGEINRARSQQETSGRLSELELNSSVATAAERLTLDCSSGQVRQILLDHLSARLITPKQLQSDIGISSLSGRRLLLSSIPSKKIVVVDGQPVIAATRAKNGMVYVVNKFLNLTQQVPNVIDLIESQPNLTTFLSYLSFSSLAERLKRGKNPLMLESAPPPNQPANFTATNLWPQFTTHAEPGPLTVLAPTNEAFEQLSSSARQLINSDPAALMGKWKLFKESRVQTLSKVHS